MMNANSPSPIRKQVFEQDEVTPKLDPNGNPIWVIDPQANGLPGLFLPSIVHVVDGAAESGW